jgi:hypothetical protein
VVGDLNEANIGLSRQAARAEAAIARVRRLCELTIAASVRVQAIDQARDTLAALDDPTDTAADIPADKNVPTIPNGQVSVSELVDNGADTPAAEFSDGEVFEYGCFNCCKPITVGQLAEHRCEQPEQSARTTPDNSPTSSDTPDNPPRGVAVPDWTPPPPGDRREQLPAHLLALIQPYLLGYTSTACQTADYLAQAIADHPEVGAELAEWRERMGARCRRNQKYTGEICPHHEQP